MASLTEKDNVSTNLKVTLEVGRILLALIFILSGASKFVDLTATAGFVASKGVPAATLAVLIAGIIEVVCGLSILFGYKANIFGTLLFIYLIPVTLIMHNFWAMTGMDRQMQTVNFMKNLAIMGGLIHYTLFQTISERGLVFEKNNFATRLLPRIPITES